MKNVISVAELRNRLNDPNLVILDATIPKVAGTAPTLEKRRIPGARFFDIKKAFSDTDSPLPNTLPHAEQFQVECRTLGINKSSALVVYDDWGIYSSPRVWWMFQTMGHFDIVVLDGGLPEWERKGYRTESAGEQRFPAGNFEAKFDPSAVKDFSFIRTNIKEAGALVIDARSSDRFHARVPEPRKELRSGHIPGSINIPYTQLLEGGKFKSAKKLKEVFKPLESETRPLVFSCGSGITACIVSLASESVLPNKKGIYDGSWTEYAQLTDQVMP